MRAVVVLVFLLAACGGIPTGPNSETSPPLGTKIAKSIKTFMEDHQLGEWNICSPKNVCTSEERKQFEGGPACYQVVDVMTSQNLFSKKFHSECDIKIFECDSKDKHAVLRDSRHKCQNDAL